MPRLPPSTAFSASSAASVAAPSGSSFPLTRMLASSAASVMTISSLRGGAQRRKTLDAERADQRLGHIVEDEARERIRGDRRKQDSVAVMAGGVEQPVERPVPEDRRVVAAAGT